MKHHANLIGGEWVEGAGRSPNLNPSDLDDVVGEFSQGSAEDVDRAVAAATAALPGWSRASAQVRGDVLDRVGDRLLAREAELGELLAREEGKTLAEARGEVQRAGRIFKFFAGETLRAIGDILPSLRPGVTVEARREPVNDTASIPRCAMMASPTTEPRPITRLNTPGGAPASRMISASAHADAGTRSAGFITTQLP